MPRVDRDGHEPADRRAGPIPAGPRGLAGFGLVASRDRAVARLACGFVRSDAGLLQQRHERIDRLERIDVQHQPVTIVADRREQEHLGLDLGLQVDRNPDHPRLELSHAQVGDIGIVGEHLAGEALLHARGVHVIEVEHQALRILQQQKAVLQRLAGLQGHAGIVLGRPDAYRPQLVARPGRGYEHVRNNQRGPTHMPGPARRRPGAQASRSRARHCAPVSVIAAISAVRAVPR